MKLSDVVSQAALSDFSSHPHGVTLTVTALPFAGWIMDAQAFFTASTAILATAWYLWLFYGAWKGRKKE